MLLSDADACVTSATLKFIDIVDPFIVLNVSLSSKIFHCGSIDQLPHVRCVQVQYLLHGSLCSCLLERTFCHPSFKSCSSVTAANVVLLDVHVRTRKCPVLGKAPRAARCPRSTICCSCSLCCGPLNICGLVTSVTSSFMQPAQCSSPLSDDPDLSMNGVFFVFVLSCPRRDSVASIVHFAALLLISSFKSSASVCTAQRCLLEPCWWTEVSGHLSLVRLVLRGVLQDAHIERSQFCLIFKMDMAFAAVFLELADVAFVFALEIRW